MLDDDHMQGQVERVMRALHDELDDDEQVPACVVVMIWPAVRDVGVAAFGVDRMEAVLVLKEAVQALVETQAQRN